MVAWSRHGAGLIVGGNEQFLGLFVHLFLAAGVFQNFPVRKSACVSKAACLQPRPFVAAVVGLRRLRQWGWLDGRNQTQCPPFGRFVVTQTCQLESCSFLCLRVMILTGVILTLRLDSSGRQVQNRPPSDSKQECCRSVYEFKMSVFASQDLFSAMVSIQEGLCPCNE